MDRSTTGGGDGGFGRTGQHRRAKVTRAGRRRREAGVAGSGGCTARGGRHGAGGRGGTGGTARLGGAAERGATGTAGRGGTGGAGGTTGRGGTTGTGGGLRVRRQHHHRQLRRHRRQDFSTYWDQITPENAGKWGSVQSSAGAAFNWRTLDAIYDYTQQKGILFKEHTFVWGSQQPGGSISEANVKTWMTEFCKRYPNTKLIDVVNEPPPHTTPAYANSIGGGTNGNWQWITNAFKWAREACPNAILILNDYNNIEWSDDNHALHRHRQDDQGGAARPSTPSARRPTIWTTVRSAFSTMKTLLTKLHTDTPCRSTSPRWTSARPTTTSSCQLYQQYFPLFRDSGYVKGITIWGWIYGKTWSPAPNSGLIRNGSPRPAMTWLMQQLGRPAP